MCPVLGGPTSRIRNVGEIARVVPPPLSLPATLHTHPTKPQACNFAMGSVSRAAALPRGSGGKISRTANGKLVRRHFGSMAASGRKPSFPGSASQLAEVLLPFADSPSICRYGDESATTAQAKLIKNGKDGIDGHLPLLAKLYELNNGLSFTKNTVDFALKEVYETKMADKQSWAAKLTTTELEDWQATIGRRLRNLMRVTSQAELKSPAPSWLKMLPWRTETSTQSDAGAAKSRPQAAVASGASSNEWSYKFSTELMLPMRSKGALSEPGLPIKCDSSAPADQDVVGQWPDGSSHRIEGFTMADLGALVNKGRTADGVLYEVMHKILNHRITIRQKIDRKLLLLIKEQDKQVCMVSIDMFGCVLDQKKQLPETDVVLVKALDFMTKLANDFADGKLQKSEMLAERSKRLAAEGFCKPAARKKPAACADRTAKTKASLKKPASDVTAENATDIDAVGEENGEEEIDKESDEEETSEENTDSAKESKEDDAEAADASTGTTTAKGLRAVVAGSMKRPAAAAAKPLQNRARVTRPPSHELVFSMPAPSTAAEFDKFSQLDI